MILGETLAKLAALDPPYTLGEWDRILKMMDAGEIKYRGKRVDPGGLNHMIGKLQGKNPDVWEHVLLGGKKNGYEVLRPQALTDDHLKALHALDPATADMHLYSEARHIMANGQRNELEHLGGTGFELHHTPVSLPRPTQTPPPTPTPRPTPGPTPPTPPTPTPHPTPGPAPKPPRPPKPQKTPHVSPFAARASESEAAKAVERAAPRMINIEARLAEAMRPPSRMPYLGIAAAGGLGLYLLHRSQQSKEKTKTAETLAEAHNEMIGDRRGYPLSAVMSEMKELLQDRNKEELSDVAWTTQSYLYSKGLLPGRMPALGQMSLKKYRDRDAFMKGEMKAKGMTHSREYNQGGSNWVKPEKVTKAFEAAGRKLTPQEAQAIAGRYKATLSGDH